MKHGPAVVPYYPLAINMSKRFAVVVGGGRVAQQKVKKLLEAHASVKVVSLTLTPALRSLVTRRKIQWICRRARSTDIRNARIVIAATSDPCVNESVSRWARRSGGLVNVVDNPRLSDVISPAVFRSAKAIVAVYTNGRDPALSRDLKNFLKENWRAFVSYRHRLSKRTA